MNIKKLATEVRFNGFICFFVIIPAQWFEQLRAQRAKIDERNVRKYYDCRKIAIPPHKDETVQLNPELSVVQDKGFANAYLEYENVMAKQMPYINGPSTRELLFFNGMLEFPLVPKVITKLGNVKQMAEAATLDSAMVKVCLQFVPKVLSIEYLPDTFEAKDVLEDRSFHLARMDMLRQFCQDQGILKQLGKPSS